MFSSHQKKLSSLDNTILVFLLVIPLFRYIQAFEKCKFGLVLGHFDENVVRNLPLDKFMLESDSPHMKHPDVSYSIAAMYCSASRINSKPDLQGGVESESI